MYKKKGCVMKNRFLKLCCLFLTAVMLVNMLPMSILAAEYQAGVASSLIGTGAGKVVQKIANKPGIRALGNMSKGKRKQIVTSLKPTIKGSERNRMKTMTYLVAKDPNIGSKYFASTETGKLITTATEGTAGGFANAGLTWAKERLLP